RCASVNYSAKLLGLTQSCFVDASGTPVAPNLVTIDTIQQYAARNSNSWGVFVPASSSFTVYDPSAIPPDPNANCGTNPNPPPSKWPGYVVTVSQRYNLINYIFSVTLSAKSCFPINVS